MDSLPSGLAIASVALAAIPGPGMLYVLARSLHAGMRDGLLSTLGTALGDWVADPETGWGLGYGGGAVLFAAGLAVVFALYWWTRMSRTALFWVAFILTRPLGATVGDFLDKPVADGGLALSRYTASGALIAAMLLLVLLLPRRAGRLARQPRD